MKKPSKKKAIRVWLGPTLALAPIAALGADVVTVDTGYAILWGTTFGAFNLLFWSWFR